MLVRAVRSAVSIPGVEAPYDTAHLTIRYPARPAQSDVERMSGMLAADPGDAPYPVVLMLPGINISSETYRWLAVAMVEAGTVCVSYDWVGELFPGQYGLTPGVEMAAVTPEGYGSRPTTPAPNAILESLRERPPAVLDGLLDLDRVAFVGHSAGGTVALQSASPRWFPTVRAVVTYGAHTMASQQLGHPAGTLLASPAEAPVMLIGGTEDGVVAASAIRYGEDAGAPAHDPIERTWREALAPTTESWLLLLEGAGHLLPCHPADPTSARGFLEAPKDSAHEERLRSLLAEVTTAFVAAHLRGTPEAKAALEALLDHPPAELADVRRR
ncbi:alpha/beta hydrolase family protein [Nocardioides sp.]|uniref:alpha/beta hydrolase family protein n=1 Tax=Nocardioides sp. TaxID=35761 RepID=UPI0035626E87